MQGELFENHKKSSIHDSRYQKLVEVLIRHRKDAGISQIELAQRLDFNQSDISKIERLERRIDLIESLDWLRAVSKAPIAEIVQRIVEEAYVDKR